MNKDTTIQQQCKAYCLKHATTSPYGTYFSESGKKFIASKFGLTTGEVERILTQIREEVVSGK
ncbi:hypothetical protein QNI16_12535 [Cytophagaceae bacterium YF14B1]|uniref:Uncharacterized protein n=1 Tax=Xanthocytophaga flava TaxID=3048013 RepID=A0AAE3QQK6_9BACT|nr:hypothetical protein [Xanthocytophaga flavus]MDJ1481316.1 hypothetical protein [Xanthocytophaga flavus]